MIDLDAYSRAFQQVHDVVLSEPALVGLLSAAAELRDQALRLSHGDRRIGRIKSAANVGVPTEELAKKLMSVVSRIPQLEGDEDAATLRAYATIDANLTTAILHYVFRDFPHLIPRRTGPSP